MKYWNLDITGYSEIGAGCSTEKHLQLSPSPLNCSKVSRKLLHLFTYWGSLVTCGKLWLKRYSKMHPALCTNTHHTSRIW